MLDTMFQHPSMVPCHVLRTRCLFKESTPSLVLVNLHVFIRESEHM